MVVTNWKSNGPLNHTSFNLIYKIFENSVIMSQNTLCTSISKSNRLMLYGKGRCLLCGSYERYKMRSFWKLKKIVHSHHVTLKGTKLQVRQRFYDYCRLLRDANICSQFGHVPYFKKFPGSNRLPEVSLTNRQLETTPPEHNVSFSRTRKELGRRVGSID
jgi:hypothetical protein